MSQVEQVESIIRNYFDNVIIIDDQMSFEEVVIPEINDNELTLPDEYEIHEEIAAGSELRTRELNDRPFRLLEQLISDGFVTYPYKYKNQDIDVQMANLSKVLNTAKLLFVDWNLEDLKPESPEDPGKAAIEILNHYSKNISGLKCVVIYTQEDCIRVLEEVSKNFQVVDKDNFFFQEKGSQEGNSLLGFVMKKDTEPHEIIQKISQILLKDKCIPLHIMDSASRLEQSIANSIHRFNAPFEKVLLTQILSLNLKNDSIPSFLDQTLLSSVLSDEDSLKANNFLFSVKIEDISNTLKDSKITTNVVEEFCELVSVKGPVKEFFKSAKSLTILRTIIMYSEHINSFETLKEEILSVFDEQQVKININEIVLFLILISEFVKDTIEFKRSFLEQTFNFTKIMKYVDDNSNKVSTGSIYKLALNPVKLRTNKYARRNLRRYSESVQKEEKYLLCITPFCDTHRPSEKVGDIFKFIVGHAVHSDKELLKNAGDNYACTAVPFETTKTVQFIKWDFYNVESLHSKQLRNGYKKIATLKKEYIQNIMNRYISYQSRAGVNEMFYKETFRDFFYDIFN